MAVISEYRCNKPTLKNPTLLIPVSIFHCMQEFNTLLGWSTVFGEWKERKKERKKMYLEGFAPAILIAWS